MGPKISLKDTGKTKFGSNSTHAVQLTYLEPKKIQIGPLKGLFLWHGISYCANIFAFGCMVKESESVADQLTDKQT